MPPLDINDDLNEEEEIVIDNSKEKKCIIYISLLISIFSVLIVIGFVFVYLFYIKRLIYKKDNTIEELEKNITFVLSSPFNTNKIEYLIFFWVSLLLSSSIRPWYKSLELSSLFFWSKWGIKGPKNIVVIKTKIKVV